MPEVYLYNLLLCGKTAGYVGSTFHPRDRHAYYKNGKHKGQTLFYRSTEKYGFDNFQKITIEFSSDISDNELRSWECFYIGLFGSYFYDSKEYGLNLVKTPTLSISKDPNVAKKISEAHTGKVLSDDHKKAIKDSTKGKINIGVKRPYLSERNRNSKPQLGKTGEQCFNSKKVDLIDLYGNIIKTYGSARCAGKDNGRSGESIQYCCNKKITNKLGLIFRWH